MKTKNAPNIARKINAKPIVSFTRREVIQELRDQIEMFKISHQVDGKIEDEKAIRSIRILKQVIQCLKRQRTARGEK